MNSFASELAHDIRQESAFWVDLASLRAVGIRSTLLSTDLANSFSVGPTVSGPNLDGAALIRLLNSASVFAQATDEPSRDLAQQIAVFASLASSDADIHDAAVHILSGLGNFPGLNKLRGGEVRDSGLAGSRPQRPVARA